MRKLAIASLLFAACDTYDAPPEGKLLLPTSGIWEPDSPIELTFTEPIDGASLVVSVYKDERNIERELPATATPVIGDCTLATQPCGGLGMALDASGTKLTLSQNAALDGVVGLPLMLIVKEGLADVKGNPRKVDSEFFFQVSPESLDAPTDIALETGAFSFVMDLQVVPLTLHMIMDLAVDPETGRTVVVGTVARLVQQEPALPANYPFPAGNEPDLSNKGWAIYFVARVSNQPDGSYFIQSEPFDVNISVANGAIPITLSDFQVQGTIVPGGAVAADCVGFTGTCEGRDKAGGNVSTSGGSFEVAGQVNPVEPISSSWVGYGYHASELDAWAGLPRVCEDAPCDVLGPIGGDCQPPNPWDPNNLVFADGETANVCAE